MAVALGGWNLALQRQLTTAEAYRTGVDQALDLAAQPGSVTALLAAEDGSVSGFGVVGADGTVKLAVRGLPATSGSQVYTAWSIEGDTAPVSMGDFTVGSDGVAVTTAHGPQRGTRRRDRADPRTERRQPGARWARGRQRRDAHAIRVGSGPPTETQPLSQEKGCAAGNDPREAYSGRIRASNRPP